MSTSIDALMGSSLAAETILKGKKTDFSQSPFGQLLDHKVEEAQRVAAQEHIEVTEIIRRIMPDGTIMVTKYNGSKVVERHRQAPVLSPVADGEATAASGMKLLGNIF